MSHRDVFIGILSRVSHSCTFAAIAFILKDVFVYGALEEREIEDSNFLYRIIKARA